MAVCQMKITTALLFNPAKTKKPFLHQLFHHIFLIKLGPCRPRRLQGVTVNFWIPKHIAILTKFCKQ